MNPEKIYISQFRTKQNSTVLCLKLPESVAKHYKRLSIEQMDGDGFRLVQSKDGNLIGKNPRCNTYTVRWNAGRLPFRIKARRIAQTPIDFAMVDNGIICPKGLVPLATPAAVTTTGNNHDVPASVAKLLEYATELRQRAAALGQREKAVASAEQAINKALAVLRT